MRLVTYASDPARISFSLPAVNLWQGEEWRGLMQKVWAVDHYLRTVPRSELVLFVDAYDVEIMGTLEEIEARYREITDGVLVNAETNPYPHPDRAEEFPDCGTPFRYMNSGCYIGKAQDLITLFDKMRVQAIPVEVNDQLIFTEYYLASRGMTLDTDCRLFQCLYQAHTHVTRNKDGYFNTLTGTRPIIIHANGSAGFLKE